MSFSDLMESGRGPGVIGTMLALVVVAGFGTLFMFAFDERMQGGDHSIESIITQQAKDIDTYKGAIATAEQTLGKSASLEALSIKLTVLKKNNQARAERITSLNQGVEAGQAALSAATAELAAYKDRYRALVRGQAKGQTIPRLQTSRGTVYENLSIREVSAIGMQIRYDGGLARIPYEELPPEMQDHFQFDAQQKAAASAQESATRQDHETAVSEANLAAERLQAAHKQKDAEAVKVNSLRANAMNQARIVTLQGEIEGLQKAILMESHKRISRAPILNGQLADKQRELAECLANISH